MFDSELILIELIFCKVKFLRWKSSDHVTFILFDHIQIVDIKHFVGIQRDQNTSCVSL
jgi:hypothetical protein